MPRFGAFLYGSGVYGAPVEVANVTSDDPPPSLRIDLYSASGEKLNVPPLAGTAVLAASYTQEEKKVGSFALTVAFEDPAAEGLVNGRQVWFTDSLEGLVFKGVVDRVETLIQGERRVKVATGSTPARLKLVKQTTLNRRFSADTLSTIVTALLSGSGFSAGTLAVPVTNLTLPLFGNPIWEALKHVADSFGLLLREDNLNSEIDIAGFGDNSGLVFGNVDAHTPELADNPLFAAITSIRVSASSGEVYNKLIPLGQQQSIASTANAPYLTLQNSSRSSPYTVQNAVNPDGTTYWYISDAASILEHGECERYFAASFVAPLGTSTTDLERAANTLYDLAVTSLLREKDEQTAYDVEVVGLRHRSGGAYTFEVGQKVRIDYDGWTVTEAGAESLLSVHEDLWVMGYTRSWSEAGASSTRLSVSTIARAPMGSADVITDFIAKLTGQQVVPMPFVIFGDDVARFAPTGLEFVCPTDSGIIGAEERKISWYDDAGFQSVRAHMFAAYNAGLNSSYFVTAVRSAADGVMRWGFYDFAADDWDCEMFFNDLTGGFNPVWGLRNDANANPISLWAVGSGYELHILDENGVDSKIGGAMAVTNEGPVLIPEGPGPGNVVAASATDNTYGSWTPLVRDTGTALATPTGTTFGSATSHSTLMPPVVTPGDLLVAILALGTTAYTVTPPAGWSNLGTQGSNPGVSVLYKVADGTEDGTSVDFVTSASVSGAIQVWRFPVNTYSGIPSVSTIATGTSVNPNPSTLTRAGKFYSIAVAAPTGISGTASAIPTGYTGGAWNGAGNASLYTAYKSIFGEATEDPATFTIGANVAWAALTVGVSGLAAAQEEEYLVGAQVDVQGTPTYVQVQLAKGAAGAESIIGTFKVTGADQFQSFSVPILVALGDILSARSADDGASNNHVVTLAKVATADLS